MWLQFQEAFSGQDYLSSKMIGKPRALFVIVICSLNLLLTKISLCQPKDTTEVRRITAIAKKLQENRPDSMLIYVERGFQLAKEIDDKQGLISLFNLKGAYHWIKGSYIPAIEAYNQSLELSRKYHKPRGILTSFTNLGMVYSKLSEYPQAIEYFLKAIALGDSIHSDNSNTYNSLGVVYKKNSNFDLAIKALEERIKVVKSQRASSSGLIGGAYTNLGNVYLNMGDLEQSMSYQKKALHVFDSLHQNRGIAICYNNISDILIRQKKISEALIYSEKALTLSHQDSFYSSEAMALESLSSIASSSGNNKKAIDFLKQAIALAETHHHRDELIKYYNGISRYYELLHQNDQALFYQKKYSALKDSVFNHDASNKMANLRVGFEIHKREKDLELANKEREIALLNRDILISIITSLIIILFVFALYQYSRIKKNKLLLSQQEIIHQTKQQLMEVDLENQKLKHTELEKEIEHKSKELTTHALNLLQKNQLLEEIKGGLATIDNQSPDLQRGINKLLGSINISRHQDKEWLIFKAHFEEVNQGFFENLSENYPDLSGNDIKVCALVKLNLSSKEIGSILGISMESAKMARHRLRKKLNLKPSQNLVSFLSAYQNVEIINNLILE